MVELRGGSLPDVSVIVPIYNTMPYLTACLESLASQSIGMGRQQIVLVDDGSTDGGAEEVDRFAARFPADVVVRHQENSGGPANPCNEGLKLATGKYVFFLGSDDYLAANAMERLITRAEEWDSDIIFGTMVGVNDRYVDQRMFTNDEPDVGFVSHPLAYSLSQTKLFRRSLIEEHSIHFPEELSVGEDQLFVVRAILNADRVSVLSGEPFYYAVKRQDASNITYSVPWRPRLRDVTTIIHGIAELVPAGELRDSILRRHFHFELGSLLKRDFAQLDHAEQADLVAAYAELADNFLTDRVAQRLTAEHRVRARLAHHGDLLRLREFAELTELSKPTLVLRAEQAYSRFPGFDHYPDDWYQHNPKLLLERMENNVSVTELQLTGEGLLLQGKTQISVETPDAMYVALVKSGANQPAFPARRVATKSLKSRRRHPVTMGSESDGGEFDWQALVPFPIPDDIPPDGISWEARLRLVVDKWTYDLPITFSGAPTRARSRHELTWQWLRLAATADGNVGVHQQVIAALRTPKVFRRNT